jgi:hypothetical protein
MTSMTMRRLPLRKQPEHRGSQVGRGVDDDVGVPDLGGSKAPGHADDRHTGGTGAVNVDSAVADVAAERVSGSTGGGGQGQEQRRVGLHAAVDVVGTKDCGAAAGQQGLNEGPREHPGFVRGNGDDDAGRPQRVERLLDPGKRPRVHRKAALIMRAKAAKKVVDRAYAGGQRGGDAGPRHKIACAATDHTADGLDGQGRVSAVGQGAVERSGDVGDAVYQRPVEVEADDDVHVRTIAGVTRRTSRAGVTS